MESWSEPIETGEVPPDGSIFDVIVVGGGPSGSKRADESLRRARHQDWCRPPAARADGPPPPQKELARGKTRLLLLGQRAEASREAEHVEQRRERVAVGRLRELPAVAAAVGVDRRERVEELVRDPG